MDLRTQSPTSPRGIYRQAIVAGLERDVATNLTAYLVGLPIAAGERGLEPWQLRTVEALLFLRWAREHGRLIG